MTSCSSSVSVQRSSKTEDQRSKSCGTACSSNSSCFFQKRKPMNPLMYPVKPSYTRNSGNTVRQRVLSAKLLKLRSLQNQLNDANFHLSEISKENQILKNLQKRQDKALSKYEGMNEDLPRLLHAHEEQTRTLSEKNKALRKNVKELTDLLKTRDEELARAQERMSHLEKLNRDKHLIDREKLMEQLEDLKIKLQKSDEQVALLNRKLLLETKASKQRLNAEMLKHKLSQKQLSQTLLDVERLNSLLETKENVVQPRKQRFNRLSQRQSISMVTLPTHPSEGTHLEKVAAINDLTVNGNSSAVTDVKLEPIKGTKQDDGPQKNGILDLPSESIKNRLSSNSSHSRESADSFTLNDIKEQSSGSEISLDFGEDLTGCSETEIKQIMESKLSLSVIRSNDMHDMSNCPHKTAKVNSRERFKRNRPSSSLKLEKLSTHLDALIQKGIKNSDDNLDSSLGDLCSDVVSRARNCDKRLEAQKESLKNSEEDTATLFEAFKKTNKLESRLKNSLLNLDGDFVNEIISEELSFQFESREEKVTDRNGNVRKNEPRVTSEEKKKLLATLKAIDNGDSLDSLDNSPAHRRTNLTKEIFSDML